jgi:hypothetical protein
MFLQYFFRFLSFFFFLSSLFFIVQLVSIVDINPCIVESCHHHWRRLIYFPMLLRWSDSLSISHNTGNLFLFSDVWELFWLHRLLCLLITRVMVLGNCSHRLCSQCMVEVMLHGIHCGFSMTLVVSVDKLLVPVLHQFRMVLLILVQFIYDDSSSSSSCPAIPSDSSWMG